MSCSAVSFNWWLVATGGSFGLSISLLLYGMMHRGC